MMTATKIPSGNAGDVVVLHVLGSVMTSPLRKLISAFFFKCIVEEISAAHRLRPFAGVGKKTSSAAEQRHGLLFVCFRFFPGDTATRLIGLSCCSLFHPDFRQWPSSTLL